MKSFALVALLLASTLEAYGNGAAAGTLLSHGSSTEQTINTQCRNNAQAAGLDLQKILYVRIEELPPSSLPYYLKITRCEKFSSPDSRCHEFNMSGELDSRSVGRISNQVWAWVFFCPANSKTDEPYPITELRFTLYQKTPWYHRSDRVVGTANMSFNHLLQFALKQSFGEKSGAAISAMIK